MENQTKELIELFAELSALTVNPSSISTDDMPQILDAVPVLKDWIGMVQAEAIHRLSEGTPVKGYTIHIRQYRHITDVQAAIDTLKKYNPDAVSECMTTTLANITRIKQVIGKKAFEDILGHFTATRTTQSLMKIPNDLSDE